jgi:hypothetical protein
MLTGTELISKVKELGDVSKSDLVRACGYVSTKKDGSERLNFTAFYEALLEAKGVSIAGPSRSDGRMGRKLSYTTKVQFNGNLLIGKAYTALLGLEPGDVFEIKLGRKQIKLIPSGSVDEEGGTEEIEGMSPLVDGEEDILEEGDEEFDDEDDGEDDDNEEDEEEDDEEEDDEEDEEDEEDDE